MQIELQLEAWNQPAQGDLALLSWCHPPVLDIGCGPGRLAAALAEAGHPVLGIDIVPAAVASTRDRGAVALLRDVFDHLPAKGRWQTALLANGTIGIGGEPLPLLQRLRDVLVDHGRVVVDLSPPGVALVPGQATIDTGQGVVYEFPWALVGVDAIEELARAAGFSAAIHRLGRRWFAVLDRTEGRHADGASSGGR